MLIVLGTISALPAEMARFVAEIGELATVTRQRDGNLSYDVAVLEAESGRLLVAECWRDEAALAAHLRADDTVAFVSRWQGRTLGDVRKYDAGNARSLAVK